MTMTVRVYVCEATDFLRATDLHIGACNNNNNNLGAPVRQHYQQRADDDEQSIKQN